MAKKYEEISDNLKAFIEDQHIFFVGTAAADGRVNISPKGLDSLRVHSAKRVYWLNVTGSGNETAAHVEQIPRMTLMFASFSGSPMILRLYGTARAVNRNDENWETLYALFPETPGARQIFELNIDLVQTSCGMAVPTYEYLEDRDQLTQWAAKRGESGVQDYWLENNQVSLDGKPTHIKEKNT